MVLNYVCFVHAKVTMSSTSKSNQQKPKEQWQVMQPTRNWLDLPSDVMANILSRVGVHDILENAEKVCTTWRKICKDPSMWRVIFLGYSELYLFNKDLATCKRAVDRSQGQLIDITFGDFGFFGAVELLQYVANRSSQLRRLKIKTWNTSLNGNWYVWTVLKKFPLLEELSFHSYDISERTVESVCCYCPLLKTLKLNIRKGYFRGYYLASCDKMAITIGENLHELEHLELIGNQMSNIGLQVILDGCHHLKSLDLRKCRFLDLEGDLGIRCSQQIKYYVCFVHAKVTLMPSTSKSKRQKMKEQWQVIMQPTRNWLELPSDVMASILSRVGLHDIIENAEKVCTTWRKICKDPSMWRDICIDYSCQSLSYERFTNMCKLAVDRSQGQLIDVTIAQFGYFGDFELLQYVADSCSSYRSSHLRRLKIKAYNSLWCRRWTEELKKFPLLEEFSLYSFHIPKEVVETVGCYVPLLKTLKLNKGKSTIFGGTIATCDKMAIAIGENLHELEHLELIGNQMSNNGLQVILDGCLHLKSLDLRKCRFLDLEGDLGKRCSQQIKCLKLPNDSLEGCQYVYGHDSNQ
ncbi:hypothetical protein OSB04_un000455 [Centaurea solstitialis]|uniref:F-box domain-containing protein n=1 Tax=Centaurea solstitialis TaxID=347529 RepID=A0AA38SQG3_9ASTR|nr:hypothetical protein OSB04_un000455 [Centaurea solstitialis]